MSDEKKDAKTTGGVGHGAPLAVDKVLVFEVTESGSRAKRTLRFNKKRVVVGSVVSADVRLTGPGVSPIHAVIELGEVGGDGIATLYDIASESGVKVNGKSAVTQVLKNGDEIAIATDSIQFRVETVVEQPKEVQPKVPSRTAAPQKLFINPVADPVASLIDEDDEVEDIFDYRPSHKQALEVVMSWKGTILDVQHFVLEKEILVGPNMDCDFGIPAALSDERFPLAVQREGEGSFNLNVDATMGGVLQSGGKLRSIGEIAGQAPVQGTHGPQIPLGKDDFAKISLGNVDFYLSYTAAPPRLKARRLFERDPFFLKVMFGSLAFTAAVIAALLNINVPQVLEAEELPERIATILYQPEKFSKARPVPITHGEKFKIPEETPPVPAKKEPPKKKVVDLKPSKTPPPKVVPKEFDPEAKKTVKTRSKRSGAQKKVSRAGQKQAKEGEGARAKGTEGTRGTKTSKRSGRPQNKALRTSPTGGEGRGGGESQVADHGNLDVLKGATSKIQNLLGNSAARLGKDGSQLKGFGGFDTRGKGGLGLSGSGTGGGGTADTTLGGLGNKGRGGGKVGVGLGAAGTGDGIIGGKVAVVPLNRGGSEEVVVGSAIDASAVEAAILAHKDEFRLCYEKEVNAGNPDLAGSVHTSFVIGSSGRVTRAGISSSSLGNANTEKCVLEVLRRIDFPRPRGGGIVEVKYPFKFRKTTT